MSDKVHSADVTPGRDGSSHHLWINGVEVARFNDLQNALASRDQFLMPFMEEPEVDR